MNQRVSVRGSEIYRGFCSPVVMESCLMSGRGFGLCAWLAVSLLWNGSLESVLGDDEVKITPDIVYGHKDGLALTMDRYDPPAVANGASVVFMVSGGWVSRWAPPENFRGLFDAYLNEGFTVFSVRHGSSPRYGIPDAVSDVRRAIRFIRLQAPDSGLDADRLGVLGMSAGGHLALVLATTGDDGNAEASDPVLQQSSRVATVAAVVPPTDLRVMVWEAEESLPAYRNFPALNLGLEAAADYSPLVHVSDDDASALVISGTQDDLVPAKHGEWIAEAFEKSGVRSKLLLLDADHGLQGKQPEAFAAITAWFSEQLAAESSP